VCLFSAQKVRVRVLLISGPVLIARRMAASHVGTGLTSSLVLVQFILLLSVVVITAVRVISDECIMNECERTR